MEENWINRGHRLARKAEAHEEFNELDKAIETHHEAAISFSKAASEITNEQSKDMLLKLKNKHELIIKELENKSKRLIQNDIPINSKTSDETSIFQDEDDPFDTFLETVEDLMHKISNPVAFITAPLTTNTNNSQNNDFLSESFFVVPNELKSNDVILSNNKNNKKESTVEENERLKKENIILKDKVQRLEKCLETKNNSLKNSLIQFKNELTEQTQKIKQSQMYKSIIQNKSAYISAGNDSSKLQELQTTINDLMTKNSSQAELILRYKERWENLKEHAKKKMVNNKELNS